MKNLFYTLLLLCSLSFQAASASDFVKKSSHIEGEDYFRKNTIKGTITLSGGCTITYSITIEYTIIPPAIQGASGTLTMSGPCSGSQTFSVQLRMAPKGTTVVDASTNLADAMFQTGEFDRELVIAVNNAKLFN